MQKPDKRSLLLGLVAVAGLVVLVFVVLQIVNRDDDDGGGTTAPGPAAVLIEAADDVCWKATFAIDENFADLQPQYEGCGNASYPLQGGNDRAVQVAKVSEGGTVSVSVVDDDGEGDEIADGSTEDPFGVVVLSP